MKKRLGVHVIDYFAYTGIALLLLSVFIRSELEISRQTQWFIWGTGILLICALYFIIFKKKLILFNAIDVAILILSVYLLLNSSFISKVTLPIQSMNLLYGSILYFIFRVILSHQSKVYQVITGLIVFCSVIEIFIAFKQFYTGRPITGTFSASGPLGGYLAVGLSIVIYYTIQHSRSVRSYMTHIKGLKFKEKWNFFVYVLCCFIVLSGFYMLFVLMNRAALLAVVIAACSMIFLWSFPLLNRVTGSNKTSYKKKAIVFISMLIVASLVMEGYAVKKKSADSRILNWSVTKGMIYEHPILGAGYGSFCGEYANLQAVYFAKYPDSSLLKVADAPEYAFNEYLQIWAETGMIGLGLFLFILLNSLLRLLRKESHWGYALIAIIVFAFFSYPFSVLPVYILTIILIAAGAGAEGQKTLTKIPTVTFSVVWLLLYCLIYHHYVTKINAAQKWRHAKISYHLSNYTAAVESYMSLYPFLKGNQHFLYEYGYSLYKTGQSEESNKILREGISVSCNPIFHVIQGNNFKTLHQFSAAEESYRYAFSILPNRLYPLSLLLQLYIETDQNNKAIEIAEKIIAFKPKIESHLTINMKKEAMAFLENTKNKSP